MDSTTQGPLDDLDLWSLSDVLKTIVFALIIIVAAVGNLLVLLAVILYRKIRATTANYFVTSLALADFLLAIAVAPFTAARNTHDPYWPFGVAYCHIWYIVGTWVSSASILSLCVISVDRYIGVTRPLKYPVIVTRRRALIAVIVTWIVSGLLSAIPLVMWPEWQPDPEMCRTNLHVGHVLTIALGNFFLPTVVLLGMYWRVYKVVQNYERSLQEGTVNNNNSETGDSRLRVHHGGYNAQGAKTNGISPAAQVHPPKCQCNLVLKGICLLTSRFQTQKRIALHLALVGGVFIVCWAPFFTTILVAMWQATGDGPSTSTITALKISTWLGYLNSCMNPFIYVTSNRQFRVAFKHMLCMKKRGSNDAVDGDKVQAIASGGGNTSQTTE